MKNLFWTDGQQLNATQYTNWGAGQPNFVSNTNAYAGWYECNIARFGTTAAGKNGTFTWQSEDCYALWYGENYFLPLCKSIRKWPSPAVAAQRAQQCSMRWLLAIGSNGRHMAHLPPGSPATGCALPRGPDSHRRMPSRHTA